MRSKMIVLFLLVRVFAYGQTDSTDIIIDQMMKEKGIAGLGLAVIKNGDAIVNKGYGLPNIEHHAPATPIRASVPIMPGL